MDEQIEFDDAFEKLRCDASEAIGDVVGSLVNRHDMHVAVVVRILRGALENFEAYMMASPEVCENCGGPLSEGYPEEDDEEDDEGIDKVSVE